MESEGASERREKGADEGAEDVADNPLRKENLLFLERKGELSSHRRYRCFDPGCSLEEEDELLLDFFVLRERRESSGLFGEGVGPLDDVNLLAQTENKNYNRIGDVAEATT